MGKRSSGRIRAINPRLSGVDRGTQRRDYSIADFLRSTLSQKRSYLQDDKGLHQAIIPAGATSVDFHIWGGGGGGGGGDRAGPGRSGSAGHYVTGTIDLTGAAGQILSVAVGSGAGGKSMGKGLTGYSGGIGGTSGPSGSSGSGGGGM